ncbi:hypothetical protein DMC25_01610 [Caulobacter sp. D4A]|uniref:hypothetical protein n=1 Tax=unclassified Caulobacter TaxID=2648921 RepID=UPI000D732E0C|nr:MULTISPECIES: hypothetical protein [unclassified Caulobacter]PXA92625.1 hypothetical protein DMC18_10565 [Caulobacter sp. D5]PXA94910.1 hypothetical protein DMC25_01610 [Caulobacter sp. D4A]
MRGSILKSLIVGGAFALMMSAAPTLAQTLLKKPDLSVSSNDGRFTGYSAALPMDLSTDAERVDFTAKVAGNIEQPTYDVNLNLTAKAEQGPSPHAMALGASLNKREAGFRSSMSRLFGFGDLPKSNYVSLSVDMNATRSMIVPAAIPLARANLRSALTLDGRQVVAIGFGGGTMGDEGVDFSLIRPFDIPAEFSVSVRAEDERVQDGRFMVKLVKANW